MSANKTPFSSYALSPHQNIQLNALSWRDVRLAFHPRGLSTLKHRLDTILVTIPLSR